MPYPILRNLPRSQDHVTHDPQLIALPIPTLKLQPHQILLNHIGPLLAMPRKNQRNYSPLHSRKLLRQSVNQIFNRQPTKKLTANPPLKFSFLPKLAQCTTLDLPPSSCPPSRYSRIKLFHPWENCPCSISYKKITPLLPPSVFQYFLVPCRFSLFISISQQPRKSPRVW